MADVSALIVHPGDVVVADFPGITSSKRRPALVISSDSYHAARPDVILGLLTGQVAAATSATDYRLRDWQPAGLRTSTAFRTFLITLPREDVVAIIGRLSDRDWEEIQTRLRLAIAI
ncbi:MAG: transcriptional regulator [Chloroflexi bacterium RBG_16_57_9]|nr:MAG: transcriptional regulator [Chloroflexi bacterium RBG_16_57_9]